MMESTKATTDSSELSCDVCSRVFDRRSRLDAHYKTHTGERPFSCPFCGKSFASKGNCNTHMRVHTRERPYQCPHCEKRFSQHGQLVIHIRRHTGEKPYICPHCNKGFTCSKVLKIHVRTHTGEKPFQCEYCHKGFAAYANLVVHRRIHTRERPYSCHLCGRAFEHSGNLSRHVRVHRVENGVRCIPCGQLFSCDQDLVAHTAHVHPNEHARDEDIELEKSPPAVESTINMQEFKEFHPPHGVQSVPPPTSEPQLTVLTPMAPPVSVASLTAVTPHVTTEPEEETRNLGTCVTLSDSEDSGRESGGSTGFSASPDQPFDRLSNQLPEVNSKVETSEASVLDSKLRILSPSTSCESPRESLVTSAPSAGTLSTQGIRMPPKKQQYPGGGRSPLLVLQTALSSQKQSTPTLAQSVVSHSPVAVTQVTPLTPPTITVPSEQNIHPDTSAPNSPHLNIHQLSLSQQIPPNAITPVGLSAAPQSYQGLPLDEQHLTVSPGYVSPLYKGHSSPLSSVSSETNPLDLSQPINSQGEGRFTGGGSQTNTPLNLSQRLEVPTSRASETDQGGQDSELHPRSSQPLLSPVPSVTHVSHHLLTATVPSPPTSRSNILRRKSADVGHTDSKKNKTRKVAPPPLIPIRTPEEPSQMPSPNTSVSIPAMPVLQPPLSSATLSTTTTTTSSSHQSQELNCTVSTASYNAPVLQASGISLPLSSSSSTSTLSAIHTTPLMSNHTSTHSPPSLSILPPPSIITPCSKIEDTAPDIIIESDIPKDKLLTSPKKPVGALSGFCSGFSSPIESMRENIQRSLMSLLPAGTDSVGFKRKVETALLALVGDASMKQMGYPEKTAEQVLITILDMAGKSPCADVRVDEQQRLKINMRKFLEYGFPSKATWEELGWTGRTIESIMDNIMTWISRRQTVDTKPFAGGLFGGGIGPGIHGNGELFVRGTTGGGGGGEEMKVNGSPLKAS